MSVIFHFNKKQKDKDDYVWEQPSKTPLNPALRLLLSLLITALFGVVYFYVELPAINIHALEFYWFIFLLCVVYAISRILLGRVRAGGARGYLSYVRDTMKLPCIIAVVLAAIVVLGLGSGLALFRASAYSSLLEPETGDFATDVAEISLDQIPMLDSASANNLANRFLSAMILPRLIIRESRCVWLILVMTAFSSGGKTVTKAFRPI